MLSHHRKAVLVELQMSALSRKRTLALQARRVRPRVRFRPGVDAHTRSSTIKKPSPSSSSRARAATRQDASGNPPVESVDPGPSESPGRINDTTPARPGRHLRLAWKVIYRLACSRGAPPCFAYGLPRYPVPMVLHITSVATSPAGRARALSTDTLDAALRRPEERFSRDVRVTAAALGALPQGCGEEGAEERSCGRDTSARARSCPLTGRQQ